MTYTETLKTLIGDYDVFLPILFKHLYKCGLPVDQLESDHICYRVSSQENYDTKKEAFLKDGHELLSEAVINGRPICTFKLQQPIVWNYTNAAGQQQTRQIPLVELPSPKPSKPQVDGLEHVEFVTTQEFQSFIDQYDAQIKQHGGAKWILAALKKEINADVEVECELTKEDKLALNHPSDSIDQRRTFSAKFHHESLEKVIEYEKALELEEQNKSKY
ncbi:dihydroxybiphenyl dioxygenase domain-containing protein [Cavenderia fasciculata]|uniref:Dihydroxybiphenyl dioxygenase domain-containing protein n=1 Tax=Cavenderia fasciculata TaxID=261658 RepID=F4PTK1_CACFS|nr:dihydroxybiphenyl dioxygenase domain-containing protein [Cavenderia fasciculata]EGG20883.1 dihydroxybiphenyl dioxygenase domain-containing protein [Cavenderia fasciculata]|eukprot:XP_004358733.1 dihydroxybiphenyl dioxygenase domain-containing protein [Cavenderia fasciculata]